MKVGISQSNYIPWRGYFDIINKCDLFIFYDDVQYTVRDWRNRNKIKTKDGLKWLTIPVGHIKRDVKTCDVLLPATQWQYEHWQHIYSSYWKSSHFDDVRLLFEKLYFQAEYKTLSELNQYFIENICHYMGITTILDDSRHYTQTGTRKGRILNILKEVGATDYYCGPAARNYITDNDFRGIGIDVHWMDYSYPEYPQLYGDFQPNVSIVDLIFNTGKDAIKFIHNDNAI